MDWSMLTQQKGGWGIEDLSAQYVLVKTSTIKPDTSTTKGVCLMLRKTLPILMSLIIILGLAGPASAAGPEPTTCDLIWFGPDGGDVYFTGEGSVVYNETSQVANVSCDYTFDFTSGDWMDVAGVCEIYPDFCNPSQTVFTLHGWYWYSEEYGFAEDVTWRVKADGEAHFTAQVAPGQCNHSWNLSYTYLPTEPWTEGTHSYYFIEVIGEDQYPFDPVVFSVSEDATLFDSNVRMGPYLLRSIEGVVDTIHPAQEAFIQVTYLRRMPRFLEWERDNLTLLLVIDDGEPITLQHGPITNGCASSHDNLFLRNWGYIH